MTHRQKLDDTGMEEIRVRITGASRIASRRRRLATKKVINMGTIGWKEEEEDGVKRWCVVEREMVSCLREKGYQSV